MFPTHAPQCTIVPSTLVPHRGQWIQANPMMWNNLTQQQQQQQQQNYVPAPMIYPTQKQQKSLVAAQQQQQQQQKQEGQVQAAPVRKAKRTRVARFAVQPPQSLYTHVQEVRRSLNVSASPPMSSSVSSSSMSTRREKIISSSVEPTYVQTQQTALTPSQNYHSLTPDAFDMTFRNLVHNEEFDFNDQIRNNIMGNRIPVAYNIVPRGTLRGIVFDSCSNSVSFI